MKRLSMLRRICAWSVTRTISDATQRLMRLNWLMMRLMFGQSRACASAESFIQARDISSLGRTSTKSARAASAILPRDLDRVVVEQRAALRIELVAAVLEHFLGRRQPLAVKR